MWKRLRSIFRSTRPKELTISSHGQEACGIPFEQIKDVMEWLGLSLIAAGYRARAHIIWDNPATNTSTGVLLKGSLMRAEPVFLYRCGERPMEAPSGCYWRLMSEYPTLRMYQLELKDS